MFWTTKELEDDGNVKLVRFMDGRLFSILPTRNQKGLKYSLGDEFGVIEGKPNNQGPFSESFLISVLNMEGAEPISLGDAQQVRAEHRVRVKQKAQEQ